MRRWLIALLLVAAPAGAADEDRIAETEARLVALQKQRQAQQAALAEARGPLVRLLAGVELIALRPPMLALVEPRSTDDMIHTHALLTALQPAIAARVSLLRRDLARTRGLRIAAMQTLAEIAEGKTQVSRALNTRLAALPMPPLRPGTPEPVALAATYRPPAAGRVLIGTGERAATGWRARGLTLATAGHAPVLAPALGRVGYAGPFGSYGSIVILDHGHGWTTLLTGLAEANARTGATIAQGAPLGRMGSTGPRLTLELRHYGRTVDAAAMMAH